ncbi:hypothetical protein [Nocardioides alcanivorans]|uniref:hypothetical protein n=1 Tax=Nocardioides alcanivorans TaxID=2897352 RepID=UPI001F2DE1B4|nr:hypothetical protein [Nocardioides alcanivorans]
MNSRATPYLCPYCGDGDLRPHEVEGEDGEITSPHGAWECRSCLRAFTVKMLGMIARPNLGGER